jgi:hypothetical protein
MVKFPSGYNYHVILRLFGGFSPKESAPSYIVRFVPGGRFSCDSKVLQGLGPQEAVHSRTLSDSFLEADFLEIQRFFRGFTPKSS